jgi:hypothetical protein
LRSVRESSRFAEQVADLDVSVKRLDEVLAGVTWAAATNAEEIAPVPGTDLRCIKVEPFPDIPRLRVYLQIADAEYVDLQWVEIIQEDPDEPAEDGDDAEQF